MNKELPNRPSYRQNMVSALLIISQLECGMISPFESTGFGDELSGNGESTKISTSGVEYLVLTA